MLVEPRRLGHVGETNGSGPAALVEPVPALGHEQLERAQRQLPLPGFGELAQRRLRAARVLAIGAGGLGSASVPYLAGAGVGTIGIVDDDVVEISNLHRQVAHGIADIGRPKTASLADRVRETDRAVTVHEHRHRLTAANALDVFREYDLVIDGSDNFSTRYLANDAAQLLDKPLVWGAILQYQGQVGVAWHRHGPGYRDLFPAPPAPEDVIDCAGGGVLPGLCGTVGSLLATEAMKLITGLGDPLLGRVLVYDSLTARTREILYGRDPEAAPVTELIDYEAFCAGADGPASVSAAEAIELLRGPDAPVLLDVRTREERRGRRIPGALSVPLDELEQRLSEFTGPVLVHCERGPRSVRASRLLESVAQPRYVQGGIDALARLAPELLEEEPAS